MQKLLFRYMQLDKTPEKLSQMDERLDELQQARNAYHTRRNGFIHYNMPDRIVDIEPYIGAEVSEEDLLEVGYNVVEKLVEADEIFEALKDAKNAFSKLDDHIMVSGKTAEEWRYEINDYMVERRQLVEDIFELSEPINEYDEIDFDMGLEYWDRLENAGYPMFDDE